MMKVIVINLLMVVLGGSLAVWGAPPFSAGEQLLFSLESQGIGIGNAVFTVQPIEQQGRSCYELTAQTDLSFLARQFYDGPDRICSVVTDDLERTLHYEKQRDDQQLLHVSFDAVAEELVGRIGNDMSTVAASEGAIDPLALLYAVRALELREGASLTIGVADGRQLVEVEAKDVKLVTVEWLGHEVEAWYLRPELKTLEGIFESKPLPGRTEIWLTSDSRRLPIRIVSEDADGKVISVLEEVSPLGEEAVDSCY